MTKKRFMILSAAFLAACSANEEASSITNGENTNIKEDESSDPELNEFPFDVEEGREITSKEAPDNYETFELFFADLSDKPDSLTIDIFFEDNYDPNRLHQNPSMENLYAGEYSPMIDLYEQDNENVDFAVEQPFTSDNNQGIYIGVGLLGTGEIIRFSKESEENTVYLNDDEDEFIQSFIDSIKMKFETNISEGEDTIYFLGESFSTKEEDLFSIDFFGQNTKIIDFHSSENFREVYEGLYEHNETKIQVHFQGSQREEVVEEATHTWGTEVQGEDATMALSLMLAYNRNDYTEAENEDFEKIRQAIYEATKYN